MSTHATGTFEIKSWDEQPYDPVDGAAKLTRASVTQIFQGDIEGEGSVEYLMASREDGSADFVGLHRVVGSVGGRSGSFVLQCTGTFENGTVKCSWSVVPGSGSGDLSGLRGDGGFTAAGRTASLTFDYDFK